MAENVKKFRKGMTIRELSDRLDAVGHPLAPSGVTKIEQGARRITADDLLALAFALNVSLARLLDMGEQRYRKRPVVVTATQWFQNGDHPADGPAEWEGWVVRYFRHPCLDGRAECDKCGYVLHDHGWIDTLEDGHRVCPGDWVITGVKGEHYPCKPDVFEASYEVEI